MVAAGVIKFGCGNGTKKGKEPETQQQMQQPARSALADSSHHQIQEEKDSISLQTGTTK